MSLEIQSGTPTIEARYVAYVNLDMQGKPQTLSFVLHWSKGAWRHVPGASPWDRPVLGWIGPLPVYYDL